MHSISIKISSCIVKIARSWFELSFTLVGFFQFRVTYIVSQDKNIKSLSVLKVFNLNTDSFCKRERGDCFSSTPLPWAERNLQSHYLERRVLICIMLFIK